MYEPQSYMNASACIRSLIEQPSEYLPPFEEALMDLVRHKEPKYLKEGQEVHIGFTGR